LHAPPNRLLSHLSQLDGNASDCSALTVGDLVMPETSLGRVTAHSDIGARFTLTKNARC